MLWALLYKPFLKVNPNGFKGRINMKVVILELGKGIEQVGIGKYMGA